jgi:Zn-dependent protease
MLTIFAVAAFFIVTLGLVAATSRRVGEDIYQEHEKNHVYKGPQIHHPIITLAAFYYFAAVA